MIEFCAVAAAKDGWMYTPLSVTLRYDPARPLEIGMVFPKTTWTFARDLLREGIQMGDGIGDVVICPVQEGVEIQLRSEEGEATLLFRRDDLLDFLAETTEIVPIGEENIDVDELLREAFA